MELGKIQTAWVEALEKYPERQMDNYLGKITADNIRLCCLGQALVTYNELKGYDNLILEGYLCDGRSKQELCKTWNDIGLHSSDGHFKNKYGQKIACLGFSCLVLMNDRGMTWPEIALFIRENPDLVFNKSV